MCDSAEQRQSLMLQFECEVSFVPKVFVLQTILDAVRASLYQVELSTTEQTMRSHRIHTQRINPCRPITRVTQIRKHSAIFLLIFWKYKAKQLCCTHPREYQLPTDVLNLSFDFTGDIQLMTIEGDTLKVCEQILLRRRVWALLVINIKNKIIIKKSTFHSKLIISA